MLIYFLLVLECGLGLGGRLSLGLISLPSFCFSFCFSFSFCFCFCFCFSLALAGLGLGFDFCRRRSSAFLSSRFHHWYFIAFLFLDRLGSAQIGSDYLQLSRIISDYLGLSQIISAWGSIFNQTSIRLHFLSGLIRIDQDWSGLIRIGLD